MPVCTVVPGAPQCTGDGAIIHVHPWDRGEASIPAHLRADCRELAFARGEVFMGASVVVVSRDGDVERDPRSWPDGLDVVVAGLAADGVDWNGARRAALEMLEPLGRCYSGLLDRVGRTDAPQGRLLITAAVNRDGSVAETDAEPDEIPQELAECAMRVLRKMRFGPVQNDLASIEIDLRFVYRALPFRPQPTVPPNPGHTE